MNYIKIIVNVLLGLFLGLGLSPIAISLARRLKFIDDPNSSPRKIHRKPTPRAGGIVIFIGLVLGTLINISNLDDKINKIVIAGAIIFLTGVIDDHKSITVFQKFSGQFLATTALILLGVRVQMFEGMVLSIPMSENTALVLDLIVTYLWVIGLSNAFNFIDSMDGLLTQLSQIAIFFLAVSALLFGQYEIVIFMVLLVGLLTSISVFNSHPAVYFLGDSGALFLGFVLAAVSILLEPIDLPQPSSWFLPITLFTLPLFDMFLVVTSRMRHKIKFYKASTDHTYHRLCRFGFSNNRAIEIMKLESFIWGFVGIFAIYQTPLFANLLFGLFLVNFVVSYIFLDSKKIDQSSEDKSIYYEP